MGTRLFPNPPGVFIVGLLVGCLVLGCGSVPVVHHYVLAAPTAGDAGDLDDGLVLRIAALGIAPPYDQDRLVYRVGDEGAEVGFYEQHRWAAPPADLVGEALLQGLRGTQGLAGVEPGPWDSGFLALEGRVLWLEELDRPGSVSSRVALDLTLRSPDGDRLWQRRFSAERSGAAEDVGTVVDMLRAALDELVAEVASDVSSAAGGDPDA